MHGRARYIELMDKNAASSNLVVRDSRTGRFVTVRGAGALKGSRLAIREDVDLTKPIASQALAGKKRKSAKG
jgi:hypothetical protein